MEKETKDFILKDLCGRLPFGVVMRGKHGVTAVLRTVNASFGVFELETEDGGEYKQGNVLDCKPCLRPMSSMTKREREELQDTEKFWADKNGVIYNDEIVLVGDYFDMDDDCSEEHHTARVYMEDWCWLMDWLHSHHFEHRGLIEKGLALTAPKGMYKNK